MRRERPAGSRDLSRLDEPSRLENGGTRRRGYHLKRLRLIAESKSLLSVHLQIRETALSRRHQYVWIDVEVWFAGRFANRLKRSLVSAESDRQLRLAGRIPPIQAHRRSGSPLRALSLGPDAEEH